MIVRWKQRAGLPQLGENLPSNQRQSGKITAGAARAVPAAVLFALLSFPSFAITFYESALELHAAGDFAAAEIELRNALKAAAENVPARVLLGQVLLEQDRPRAAVVELERGLELGGDRNLILVPLGECYLKLLQPQKVLTTIVPPGTDPVIDGETLLLQGDAALLLGDVNYAAQSYAQARELLPIDPRPLVGQARAASARHRDELAEELIDQALALDPGHVDALILRGLRLRDAGELAAAREAFDRALALDPDSVKALGARAALLIDAGDVSSARADVRRLRDLDPGDLEGLFLQSWLLVSDGEADAAQSLLRDAASKLAAIGDDQLEKLPQANLLFGIVNFLNRDYERAAERLKSFLARFPQHTGARRYLAATYLGAGDWDNVVRTLEPEPGAPPLESPSNLALLAEAMRARGDHDAATRYYARALAIDPEHAGFALGLAESRFAAGKIDDAIASLQALVKEIPEFLEARLRLVGMYVDAGRESDALAEAKALLREHPEDAEVSNLLGVVMMTRDRRDEAAEYFSRAREIEPDDTLAILNQARLARQADKLDVAAGHYRSVLEREPDAPDAGVEFAEVLFAQGDVAAAGDLVGRLLERRPRSVRARLVELWIKLTKGDRGEIDEAVFRLNEDFPDDPVAQTGLARVYLALDDPGNTKLMLRRANENAGFDAERQYQVARLQYELGDTGAARWALTKALDGNPRHLDSLALSIRILIDTGKTGEAEEAYAALEEMYPERAQTLTVRGHLRRSAGDLEGAIAAFLLAHRLAGNRDTLEDLTGTQIDAGDYKAALTTIRIWILRHPGDLGSRHMLGESLLEVGAYRSAQLVYQELVADEPDNPVSLNNLAFALQQQGRDKALDYAERAVAAAPEQAEFLDTYGWILVETGDPERGLEVLRDAFTRQSTNDEIRYHIALALVSLGRPAAARRELDAAIASTRPFPSRAEAEALLQQLGGSNGDG